MQALLTMRVLLVAAQAKGSLLAPCGWGPEGGVWVGGIGFRRGGSRQRQQGHHLIHLALVLLQGLQGHMPILAAGC